jgi:hypothetical protein
MLFDDIHQQPDGFVGTAASRREDNKFNWLRRRPFRLYGKRRRQQQERADEKFSKHVRRFQYYNFAYAQQIA